MQSLQEVWARDLAVKDQLINKYKEEVSPSAGFLFSPFLSITSLSSSMPPSFLPSSSDHCLLIDVFSDFLLSLVRRSSAVQNSRIARLEHTAVELQEQRKFDQKMISGFNRQQEEMVLNHETEVRGRALSCGK